MNHIEDTMKIPGKQAAVQHLTTGITPPLQLI